MRTHFQTEFDKRNAYRYRRRFHESPPCFIRNRLDQNAKQYTRELYCSDLSKIAGKYSGEALRLKTENRTIQCNQKVDRIALEAKQLDELHPAHIS